MNTVARKKLDLERVDLGVGTPWNLEGSNRHTRSINIQESSMMGNKQNNIVPFFILERPIYRNSFASRNIVDYNGYYSSGGYTCTLSEIVSTEKLSKYPILEDKYHDILVQNIRLMIRENGGSEDIKSIENILDLKTEIIDIIEDLKTVFKLSSINKESLVKSFDYYAVPEDTTLSAVYRYRTYKDGLLHFLQSNGWYSLTTKTVIDGNLLRYLIGPYFLGDVTRKGIDPLVVLVTRPEYLSYIDYSLSLSKEIDPRIFQIWVNPKFDVPRSKWKGIRPLIRKEFLIPFHKAGVPIIEKEDFSELFSKIEVPVMENIGDYKKWIKNCSKDTMSLLREDNCIIPANEVVGGGQMLEI